MRNCLTVAIEVRLRRRRRGKYARIRILQWTGLFPHIAIETEQHMLHFYHATKVHPAWYESFHFCGKFRHVRKERAHEAMYHPLYKGP